MIQACVIGAAGYVGGELLRLLLDHPQVELRAATSRSLAGRRVDTPHPNLRGRTEHVFRSEDDLPPCDVIFLAGGHGRTIELWPRIRGKAAVLIDLSADFRLHSAPDHRRHYASERPLDAGQFTMGWPERHREALRESSFITIPGCMAMAATLALSPVAAMIESKVFVDGRTGSSGAGRSPGEQNLHAERSGAMRVFAPIHHRHEAEIAQATGLDVAMTATAVEAVRGVQVVAHARAREPLSEKMLHRIYRDAYGSEPFVRIVAERRGTYRLPEPKILVGSNYCDVGFAIDAEGRRLTLVAALDNLMKGSAGNAVQCMNLRFGFPEDAGLGFAGLHPI